LRWCRLNRGVPDRQVQANRVISAESPSGAILLPGEQLEAHRLRALLFNFEKARPSGADFERMRFAGPPTDQRPELWSRTIRLRLVSIMMAAPAAALMAANFRSETR
jgi:hypothetical protein